MDIVLTILGLLCMLIGILGSILPVLPGPPISWAGLLLLHLTKAATLSWWFLGITLVVAVTITVLDYVVPAMGTKKFGGSKAGMWGTTIGLVVGIIVPIPLGILIGPFLGALIGEMINKADGKTALRAAFGSFLGFLTGTFMKLVVTVVFLVLFLVKMWDYRTELFSFG
ncbi:DUF456 domain-containing protein [Sinomicrobium weinanense]|uniref:DUF456 domain-containing protein n=1 Tax=Sinomicrobium weinanense TaxID=2842200 RepID=A0A926JVP6_9FLAO|nr:DUF456 domain-containing protein [Sinomicrobium weinanense]MBC9798437.1 DUF456 domain-containing protein [Sinomicrobium weinanense]MBU3125203.1 DUF456 domain-containing protein [Sinomicrobium weinanense]